MPKLYGNKENRRKEQKVESRNSVLVQTDESNQSITKIVISRKERVRKGDKNNNEEQSYDEIGKKEKQNYKVFENVLNLKQPFKHIQDWRKHKSLDFNGGYDGWSMLKIQNIYILTDRFFIFKLYN